MNDNYANLRKWAKDAAGGKTDKIPYLDITDLINEVEKLREAARATPAQPVGDLHNAIMNLPCNALHAASPNQEVQRAYKEGYRDARHAAAELVAAHETERSQPSPSSGGAAIRALPLPTPAHRGPDGTGSYFDSFTADQIRTLLSEAAALAEQAQGQQWISVNDRLPDAGQQVIAFRPTASLTQDPPIDMIRYLGGENTRQSWQGVPHKFDCICHPTHWMPLPAAPSIAQDGQGGDDA